MKNTIIVYVLKRPENVCRHLRNISSLQAYYRLDRDHWISDAKQRLPVSVCAINGVYVVWANVCKST